jgi:hypothetical protein
MTTKKDKGAVSKKEESKNEVMLSGSFSLADIPKYLETVNGEIEKIEEFLDENSHGKASLLEIEDLCRQKEKGRAELTVMLGQILRKEDYFKKASKELGGTEKFKFKGCSMTVVKKAFRMEFQRSLAIDKRDELILVKSEVEKYLTDDHKAKAAFENLSKLLVKK